MKLIGIRDVPFSDAQMENIKLFSNENGYELLVLNKENEYESDILKECELLVGYFPDEMINNASSLKWLHSPSAGVDKLCANRTFKDRNITVTNSSGAFGITISEYMVMSVLMLMRNIPEYMKNKENHIWRKSKNSIGTIYGSKVTVIGLGDIGSAFGRRIKALGAEVTGVSRTLKIDCSFADKVYTSDDLKEAVKDADIVAACIPFTKETEKLICDDIFSAMKDGTVFINAGRGRTVDQDSLIKHLKSGKLRGAALDVFETEPIPENDPIWDIENLIITPHISGSDGDKINADMIFEIYFENLKRYFSGDKLKNIVNLNMGY